MMTHIAKPALATAVGMLALAGAANAQQRGPSFDGAVFFEELDSRRVTVKVIDLNMFFEELANRSVKIEGLDRSGLFVELKAGGVTLPEMVLVNRPGESK